MKRRDKPTVYRKRGQELINHGFRLTATDTANLEEIRRAYEDNYPFSVSTSIIVGVALQALVEEARSGKVRTTPDLYISVPNIGRLS